MPAVSRADIIIRLKDAFIEEFKDRATISANFTVDKAHPRPNTAKKDGDLHVAGRAPEIKLPIVAELMNAKSVKPAINLIHAAEDNGQPLRMVGAWRIWCEHGGDSQQIQGRELRPFTSTNPDHVFEIHPITQLGNGMDVSKTLKPITGFRTKDAHDAFTSYESKKCKITPNADGTTTIRTTMGGYNYVEFVMEILDEQPETQPPDGRFVFASVMTLGKETIVQKRRMVFVDGTPPVQAVSRLGPGDQLHVLGLPRISLKLVSWRKDVHKHPERHPEWKDEDVLNWDLPYEMIIVGAYRR